MPSSSTWKGSTTDVGCAFGVELPEPHELRRGYNGRSGCGVDATRPRDRGNSNKVSSQRIAMTLRRVMWKHESILVGPQKEDRRIGEEGHIQERDCPSLRSRSRDGQALLQATLRTLHDAPLLPCCGHRLAGRNLLTCSYKRASCSISNSTSSITASK